MSGVSDFIRQELERLAPEICLQVKVKDLLEKAYKEGLEAGYNNGIKDVFGDDKKE